MTNPKHTDTIHMTEAEALDEAAKAAGWGSWEYVKNHCDHSERHGIRAHAKTIMENAALKAENERLREALGLADAALRGANMNMNVVERKVRAALKEIEGDWR